jgi:adenosylhomocysteinase
MTTAARDHDVADLSLADAGQARIEWADRHMPVLASIRERFEREKPLSGIQLGCCLHVTTETANLVRTLIAGGADVALCASNPLSTQDDVAAALVDRYGAEVWAINGEDNDSYYSHINAVCDKHPKITMDDGADVIGILHGERTEQIPEVIGGTEETTTGVIRLKALEAEGKLGFPIIAVNEANTKHLFDNRYGTGQSTLDGVIRATNLLIAGKRVVVFGYGWCGKGVASRAKGHGAHVIVCEVNPLNALEAVMDGFEVMPAVEAARVGDLFLTVTGDMHVIGAEHFRAMKDGAIVANSGHFNVEIDIPALEAMSSGKREARPLVEEYRTEDGRNIYLLADGRLVNLACAEGHPAAVMDMSFANQALSAEYMAKNAASLERKVHVVPEDIDKHIAELKLQTMGVRIDSLTAEQEKYLSSWDQGT